MKAALLKEWNQLALVELDKPVPGANEALIRVELAGVCGSDITVYRGLHMTAKTPVVLCHEILGTIQALPAGYTGPFSVGERVAVNPVIACGTCAACRSGYANACANLKLLGIHVNGGFAEYTTASVDKLVKVAPDLPDEVAALSEPFAVGCHVNIRAGVGKQDTILVVGAGTIGLVVALTAREMGAAQVVISEVNPQRLEIARAFGFEVIDAGRENVPERAGVYTCGAGFDVVFDAAGAKATILQLPDLCRIGGRMISLGLSGAPYEFILGKVSFKEQTLIGSRLYSQAHFEAGVQILEALSHKYDMTAMVSDVLPLDQIGFALDQMMNGQNTGKILIRCH